MKYVVIMIDNSHDNKGFAIKILVNGVQVWRRKKELISLYSDNEFHVNCYVVQKTESRRWSPEIKKRLKRLKRL